MPFSAIVRTDTVAATMRKSEGDVGSGRRGGDDQLRACACVRDEVACEYVVVEIARSMARLRVTSPSGASERCQMPVGGSVVSLSRVHQSCAG